MPWKVVLAPVTPFATAHSHSPQSDTGRARGSRDELAAVTSDQGSRDCVRNLSTTPTQSNTTTLNFCRSQIFSLPASLKFAIYSVPSSHRRALSSCYSPFPVSVRDSALGRPFIHLPFKWSRLRRRQDATSRPPRSHRITLAASTLVSPAEDLLRVFPRRHIKVYCAMDTL